MPKDASCTGAQIHRFWNWADDPDTGERVLHFSGTIAEESWYDDDLTPEEQAERRHRSKGEYAAYMKEKKEREETRKAIDANSQTIAGQNATIAHNDAEIKKAETRLKGLNTMIANLEEKREHLEIDIAALEDVYAQSEGEQKKELEEKLQNLNSQLADVGAKISDKKQKLSDVEQQLAALNTQRIKMEKNVRTVVDEAIRRHDRVDKAIKEKSKELAAMDKTGELRRAQQHIGDRDALIYRHWPAARNAVNSIFNFGSSKTATDFTPQQALDVEKAIATSGTSRPEAAEDLLALAQKDFDGHRTPQGWVDGVAREVRSIAAGTHQRLTALLKQQPKDSGGGPSYITDLTDWAGNQHSY